jgi:SAM-dependent methyltransferase
MLDWLKANRERIQQDLVNSPERRYLSPSVYGQYQVTLSLLRTYVQGRVIDLGCGDAPFQSQLAGSITDYDTLDLRPRIQTTYVGDIQDMYMISDSTYDSALSLEVLEHVPDPFNAVREIYRILKPGAVAVISVPHLSRIHEAPYDYYRYTNFGLQHMLTQAGFEVVEVRRKGGLFSFLGHQCSTLLLGSVWGLPGLRQLAWFLNKWLITRPLYALDGMLDRGGIFALGYVVVARRPLVVPSAPQNIQSLA